MNISDNKLNAISDTLLDFAKILLAALVAADFINFTAFVKIIIISCMLITLAAGILIRPDKGEK